MYTGMRDFFWNKRAFPGLPRQEHMHVISQVLIDGRRMHSGGSAALQRDLTPIVAVPRNLARVLFVDAYAHMPPTVLGLTRLGGDPRRGQPFGDARR